jgi:putative membrane protein
MKYSDKIKIGAVYFFLIAGGIWHILDVFQFLMSVLAGPLLIGLAVWLFVEYYVILGKDKQKNASDFKNKFIIWAIISIVFSFIAETIGVKTGKVFGAYQYGETLWPQIWGVPVAIGFAWLLMLISSTAVMQRINIIRNSSIIIKIISVALLMTFFDFMMEPAAIKLGYWTWIEIKVPLQNYIAWFILGGILAGLGYKMGLFNSKQPNLAVHMYIAQLIYFILIIFK